MSEIEKPRKNPVTVIIACIVLATVGAGAAVFQLVNGLDENARKLRKYKVKSSVSAGEGYEFADEVKKDRPIPEITPHQEAYKLFLRGQLFEKNEQWGEAHTFYAASIRQIEDDWKHKIRDSCDGLVMGARYEAIARCLVKRNLLPAAIAHMDCALNGAPGNSQYYLERAAIYDQLKQPLRAQADRHMAAEVKLHPPKSKEGQVFEDIFGTAEELNTHSPPPVSVTH